MFPYNEACEVFDEWVNDEYEPINEKYPEFVECPICGKEIKLDAYNPEEVWEQGWKTHSEVYHADCIREKLTLDRCFKFLDEEDRLKDFFNWFYTTDGEELITKLNFPFKMALINQYYNEKDNEYYMAQFVEQILDEFIKWMKDKNEI